MAAFHKHGEFWSTQSKANMVVLRTIIWNRVFTGDVGESYHPIGSSSLQEFSVHYVVKIWTSPVGSICLFSATHSTHHEFPLVLVSHNKMFPP
jgi:hypothetical protein